MGGKLAVLPNAVEYLVVEFCVTRFGPLFAMFIVKLPVRSVILFESLGPLNCNNIFVLDAIVSTSAYVDISTVPELFAVLDVNTSDVIFTEVSSEFVNWLYPINFIPDGCNMSNNAWRYVSNAFSAITTYEKL